MTGCRENDPAVRNLYGECLGELGAVDPGRLSLMNFRPKNDMRKVVVSVIDENFAYDIVLQLSKAFLRAEDRNTQVGGFLPNVLFSNFTFFRYMLN